ncbi:MAG: alpha/beta hydrolase family protein, partial [Gammaproteobacteria bacterium]
EDASPGYSDLYVTDLAGGSIRNLTADTAGSIDGDEPMLAGDDVLESLQMGTRQTYMRLHDDKPETLVFDSPVVSQLQSNPRHTAWVWLGMSGTQPNALYYSETLGGGSRILKTPDLLPASWAQVPAKVIQWKNEGLTIEGLLSLPPQMHNHKVPLVVLVHGGPTGAWLDNYDTLTEFLLAQGWAVLRPNPRGSTGYGRAFEAANKNDLGGADYRDIMAGVDVAITDYPIDGKRLALMGYSYGGEMAGFVEGKTDRFKAIVSGAPVIDQESEYGTEDDSWYDRWFYGKPWEHPEDAWRQSPLANAAHAKTPFLLLQGEDDTEDPLGQSLEMYRALRQEGVQVEMVQYPRVNHGPLAGALRGNPSPEPWHGFDARQRVVKFIQAGFDKAGTKP